MEVDQESKYDRWNSRKISAKRMIYQHQIEDYHSKTDKQNFKKTSWKKVLYSCGGYGGRCGNCKHHEVVQERDAFKKSLKNCFNNVIRQNFVFSI